MVKDETRGHSQTLIKLCSNKPIQFKLTRFEVFSGVVDEREKASETSKLSWHSDSKLSISFTTFQCVVISQCKYTAYQQAVVDFHYGLMVSAWASRLLGKYQRWFAITYVFL